MTRARSTGEGRGSHPNGSLQVRNARDPEPWGAAVGFLSAGVSQGFRGLASASKMDVAQWSRQQRCKDGGSHGIERARLEITSERQKQEEGTGWLLNCWTCFWFYLISEAGAQLRTIPASVLP
jgi:hypothetical protein